MGGGNNIQGGANQQFLILQAEQNLQNGIGGPRTSSGQGQVYIPPTVMFGQGTNKTTLTPNGPDASIAISLKGISATSGKASELLNKVLVTQLQQEGNELLQQQLAARQASMASMLNAAQDLRNEGSDLLKGATQSFIVSVTVSSVSMGLTVAGGVSSLKGLGQEGEETKEATTSLKSIESKLDVISGKSSSQLKTSEGALAKVESDADGKLGKQVSLKGQLSKDDDAAPSAWVPGKTPSRSKADADAASTASAWVPGKTPSQSKADADATSTTSTWVPGKTPSQSKVDADAASPAASASGPSKAPSQSKADANKAVSADPAAAASKDSGNTVDDEQFTTHLSQIRNAATEAMNAVKHQASKYSRAGELLTNSASNLSKLGESASNYASALGQYDEKMDEAQEKTDEAVSTQFDALVDAFKDARQKLDDTRDKVVEFIKGIEDSQAELMASVAHKGA